ncbi:MAG: hypothetical protein H6668_17480 [Ardenticatenaceae bacterium]|nr:hypothetical protein [Ardenticatenaceae bacterium]
MNFPDEPTIRIIYWFIDTAGIGSIIVGLITVGILTAVGLTLNWIRRGALADESEVYTHPTPALTHHQPD